MDARSLRWSLVTKENARMDARSLKWSLRRTL